VSIQSQNSDADSKLSRVLMWLVGDSILQDRQLEYVSGSLSQARSGGKKNQLKK
jgi:hypothetical protein